MNNGFKIIKNALTDREIDTIFRYLAIMKNNGKLKGNTDGETSHMYFAPLYFEALLSSFTETVSNIVGFKVYPSYSFLWNYKKGHIVPKHKDRDSVDYIMSINIGEDSEFEYPIYIDGQKVCFNKTEALVLDGKNFIHWREECPYENRLQLILCYTKDIELKFDRRKHLGNDPIPDVITSPFQTSLDIDDLFVRNIAHEHV